jgi:diamine N-acetyltransferase
MVYLENNILKLRALEPEDLDILYRWENDSNLWRYGSTLAPYSRFSLKEYISESRWDIFQSRQLRLMITLKSGNISVGTIDLYDFDPMNLRAGIGILIDGDYRRQGLALQALVLLKDYAFRFLTMKQLYAFVPEKNEASILLFKRGGFEQSGYLHAWIKNDDDVFENVFLMQAIGLNDRV